MKCLVVGFGSIGRRHFDVLRDMGLETAIVSQHAEDGAVSIYRTLSDAMQDFTPEYVVIANPTSEHWETMQELQACGFSGQCLVEKPLASEVVSANVEFGFSVKVGYVLRFHPLIQQARSILSGQRLVSIQSYVGQYLPDWRPGSDYRASYSARKERGGGALRDLSHEFDYLMWFAGCWKRVAALGGRFSSLEINSDDTYCLLLETERCPAVACQVNYLDRNTRRNCEIQYDGGSIELDLIAGRIVKNGEMDEVKLERNDIFRKMHEVGLGTEDDESCTYREAIHTLTLINAAEKASDEGEWIWNKDL